MTVYVTFARLHAEGVWKEWLSLRVCVQGEAMQSFAEASGRARLKLGRQRFAAIHAGERNSKSSR